MKNNFAVEVHGLSVCYDNTVALHDVTFSIETGDFVGIIGSNGGGKSTLLKTMLGFLPISHGCIHFFGDRHDKVGNIFGYVPQISNIDRNFPISVLDVVLSGFMRGTIHPFFAYIKEQKKMAEAFLEKTDILNLKNRQISDLSGGEFQKLLIARALASNPKLLLLDEPTANISPQARNKIYELLNNLSKEITIILVTHDLSILNKGMNRLLCLNKTLIYDGKPELSDLLLENI